ncbi:MAG: short-chain dehydrogenase/reductase [Amycolatopsis sp.]|uniref:SDR family NAD(P)-dependent oxidoreductase n=1 Tax=Amycolatopsis sp. TaxID=37632 RepID=UPI0026235601|nr:SDR family NAD(P)-dependent oxidoreductase [Amycolatopsis sp.]MCU1686953.1 short-chain dehydrogenase/reductase [Amycolatopsis sp.]
MADSKTFFLTGASRGLGRAIAEATLAAGHRVVLTARNPESVGDLVAAYPRSAAAFALDVTDAAAAQAAMDAAVKHFGVPDVIITNADRADIVSIEDVGLADMHAVVDTNLWGVVNVVKAALPLLREAGRGHFVQISSVSGRLAPAPGLASYVAAKFAAEGFLEALALEVAGFGIAVTIVEPGRMATSIASSMAIPAPSQPYAALLHGLASAYADGASAGTTAESAARFVLDLSALDRPPLRVPLGSAAFEHILAADNRRLTELGEWEKFSRSAD